jgi:membrane protein required for colicin V production
MTWVDGVVLAVLALSAVIAFFRGFVREVLSIGAWVGAALAAIFLRQGFSDLLRGSIDPPWVAEGLAAAGIFLVVLIVLKMITAALADRVQGSMLGGVDRTFGMVFGLLRGAFLVVFAFILGSMALPTGEQWPAPVRDARVLPLVADGAQWLAERLPPGIQPRIVMPTGQPGPTQDELMRPPARNRT